MKQKFAIGTRFLSGGKNPRLSTVTDFMTVMNLRGEIVKTYYEAEHEFLGQVVREREVLETSVAMGVERLRMIFPELADKKESEKKTCNSVDRLV